MFSKRERLSRTNFALALKQGRRRSSKHFTLVVFEGIKGYAVVIPKKVLRLSVKRHRLKRQLLAVLKAAERPASGILFVRNTPSGVHYKDLVEELQTLLQP